MSLDTSRSRVVDTYRRRARHYDVTANLYYLLGFREWAYRRRAVRALGLRPGATVVEIGCGTGLNFALLQAAIGPSGHLIGVDLTDAMLEQAERRVREHGWTNVKLVQSDALDFRFPAGVDGILSTFALSLIPECGRVVERGSAALAPGGRWVVLDLKLPNDWPAWVVTPLLSLVRPFAVTRAVIERRPWDIIRQTMRQSLTEVASIDLFFGLAFIARGERSVSQAMA